MHFCVDLSKKPKKMLIDLINYSNKQYMACTLKYDTTLFCNPVKVEGQPYNTRIRFAGVDGYCIDDKTPDIEYNRLDINQIAISNYFDFKLKFTSNLSIKLLNHENIYTVDLLPQLNEVLKINLSEEDIVNEKLTHLTKRCCGGKINLGELYDKKVKITMSDSNLAFIGTLEVRLQPEPIRIENDVRNYQLGDFMPYPTHGLS